MAKLYVAVLCDACSVDTCIVAKQDIVVLHDVTPLYLKCHISIMVQDGWSQWTTHRKSPTVS